MIICAITRWMGGGIRYQLINIVSSVLPIRIDTIEIVVYT